MLKFVAEPEAWFDRHKIPRPNVTMGGVSHILERVSRSSPVGASSTTASPQTSIRAASRRLRYTSRCRRRYLGATRIADP
jgi:hypothetical protein